MSKLLNALITLTVLSITLIIFLPTLQAATVDFSIKGVKVLEENDVYVTVHSNIVYRGKLDVTAIIPGARIKTVSEQLAFTNKRAIDVKVFSLSDYPKFTGFKTVKFYVDKANKVKEACETNNGYAKSIKFPIVVPGGVDLLVTRVVPSSSCLKIILRNNGKQKFRGEVKIGISIDDTKKKDIVTKCILGPKAEKAIKYSHRLKPGRTVLKLDVDKDNKIAEGDEKNNKFKAELYPAKDLVKLDRYVAVGKPGTNSRKIQSGKELGMIQITKDMVILDKKQGIAWLQVDTAARNLGSLAKGQVFHHSSNHVRRQISFRYETSFLLSTQTRRNASSLDEVQKSNS